MCSTISVTDLFVLLLAGDFQSRLCSQGMRSIWFSFLPTFKARPFPRQLPQTSKILNCFSRQKYLLFQQELFMLPYNTFKTWQTFPLHVGNIYLWEPLSITFSLSPLKTCHRLWSIATKLDQLGATFTSELIINIIQTTAECWICPQIHLF